MKQVLLRGLTIVGLTLGAFASPAFAGNPEAAPVADVIVPAETAAADHWLFAAGAERRYYVSGFAGVITDQDFHEILLNPFDTDFLDSQMVGAALGFELPTRWSRWDFGAEVQVVKWFGDQDHWELNVMPAVGRYRFEGSAWILRSLSFGLGLSYASEVPVEEIIDDGESNRLMIYWAAEAEFGDSEDKLTPFIKLHHRSDGFGIIEEDAGSNTIALGLRRRF